MNKRLIIASTIGLLTGLFCAYGTALIEDPKFLVTTGLLASIVYNRLLIGVAIGFAGKCKLNPLIRGSVIGLIISLALGIIPLIDGQLEGGLIIIGFGAFYGAIIDFVATQFN